MMPCTPVIRLLAVATLAAGTFRSPLAAQAPPAPATPCRLRAVTNQATVTIECSEAADPQFVAALNSFLTANPNVAGRINQVLDRTPEATTPNAPTREQEVRRWMTTFDELVRRLAPTRGTWTAPLLALVRQGSLENAAPVFDATLPRLTGEALLDARIARGLLSELLNQDPQLHYDVAYRARPDDQELALRYADALRRAGEPRLAASIYETGLEPLRNLLRDTNESSHVPERDRLATELGRLSQVYETLERPADAQRVLEEALAQWILLAKAVPTRYLRDMAFTTLQVAQRKLSLPAGVREACPMARQLRQMGMTVFPLWAADLERACPAQ